MIDWVFDIPYLSGGRTLNGADCWGLVVLFYRKELGIELPLYDWVVPDKPSKNRLTCVQAKEMAQDIGLFCEVTEPDWGDIVLLNIAGMPIHVGILVDKTHMLHTGEHHGVVVENFGEIKWQRRLQGFHRHKQRM